MINVKDALKKVVDEEGLVNFVEVDVLDGMVKTKLDELVLKTDNKLDDELAEYIYTSLKLYIVNQLKKQIEKV